ncbi:hypothetical protein [Lysobacter silvisoli]|uniref:Uncharacterized protein n=1 Tax=Lysobacter silvisoli TaxID=2293254 RepID=A0A371K1Q9_9GAMM|nr:hypothetical protein [Lysobacter silvisoli]RDZ27845.1 hypothetical protein DX914_01365 [Lysobacter silvisoli]
MHGVLFLTALLAYAGVYYVASFAAHRVLGAGPYAAAPRLIALLAVAATAAAFAYWAQITFIDPMRYAGPDPVALREHSQRVLGMVLAPAVLAAVTIAAGIGLARRRGRAAAAAR